MEVETDYMFRDFYVNERLIGFDEIMQVASAHEGAEVEFQSDGVFVWSTPELGGRPPFHKSPESRVLTRAIARSATKAIQSWFLELHRLWSILNQKSVQLGAGQHLEQRTAGATEREPDPDKVTT